MRKNGPSSASLFPASRPTIKQNTNNNANNKIDKKMRHENGEVIFGEVAVTQGTARRLKFPPRKLT